MKRRDTRWLVILAVFLTAVVIIELKVILSQTKYTHELQEQNSALLLQLAEQDPGCRLFREIFPKAEAQVIKGIVELRDSPNNPRYVCDYVPWTTNVDFRRVEGSALILISQEEFLREVASSEATEQAN